MTNENLPFVEVHYIDFNSPSPARVDRKKRILHINRRIWGNIAPAHRVFILLHEYAHCYLDSSNEYAVDKQAHEWYISMGYPLTESVKALTQLLDAKTKSHVQRAYNQYKRSELIDAKN